jgi:hypothetical protein
MVWDQLEGSALWIQVAPASRGSSGSEVNKKPRKPKEASIAVSPSVELLYREILCESPILPDAVLLLARASKVM